MKSLETATNDHPFDRTWWIAPGRVLGGCYPGDPDPAVALRKLQALFDAGVRTIVCLQEEEERGRGGARFAPYLEAWRGIAAAAGEQVDWQRFPIRDNDVPTVETMRAILRHLDAAPSPVYVHCWGGHGRTGTVAGCYLVAGGAGPDEAFAAIETARAHDAHLRRNVSPQTRAQRTFVETWVDRRPRAECTGAPRSWWRLEPAVDRHLGALVGMACGDALGTTLEFTRPGPKPWSPPLDGPHREITGGGPFGLVAGPVTDDTQMACCLAAELSKRGRRYDPAATAEAYREWMGHAFDIGGQTRGALSAFGRGGDPARSGIETWERGGCRAAGNGSLMRCAPIGALIGPADLRRHAALTDSLITHADPRCALACAAFCAAIGAGIDGATAASMLEVARSELDEARSALLELMPDHRAAIDDAHAASAEDLLLAAADDPQLYGEIDLAGSAMGFVRVAFRLAFWELLHAPDLERGLIDAVNRGGDADTNGAIVGALLGAHHGLDAIPERWVTTVLDCAPPAPWNGVYHPRTLVEAVRTMQAGGPAATRERS